ncbi:secreted RxLR effector protein 161-like [Vigna umbellata]|uniref:secreted RxLR effector protein 161-like n=1 Tax=Vigna umbellata TaxID=87088 RepID=UPI001F5F3964|nr:secreted RxLR effector protein 161-like [Vigna umbellata]
MQAAKRVLRYIKGTLDYGILFPGGRKKTAMEITGYTNSDYGGDQIERKSTSGYIFMLNGAPISWCSNKQPVVTVSRCETEYIDKSFSTCQGVWIKELMKELKVPMEKPIQLKIDNVSAMNLAKNSVSHGRSKHKKVKFHFLRDMVN